MDHIQVHATHAVERYLLDELTGPEREQFEDHFFTCPDCADAVRTGTLLAVNARSVFEDQSKPAAEGNTARPPRSGRIAEMPVRPNPRQIWFQRAIGAIAATILLGTGIVYQNAHEKAHPAGSQFASRSVHHWKLAADTRGDAPSNVVKPAADAVDELDLELPASQPLPAYRVEIRNQAGVAVLTEASAPTHEGNVYIPLPPNLSPGSYKILVGAPAAFHFHFQVTQ